MKIKIAIAMDQKQIVPTVRDALMFLMRLQEALAFQAQIHLHDLLINFIYI